MNGSLRGEKRGFFIRNTSETSEKIEGYLPRQGDNEPIINRMIPHVDFLKLDLSVPVEDSDPNRLKQRFDEDYERKSLADWVGRSRRRTNIAVLILPVSSLPCLR